MTEDYAQILLKDRDTRVLIKEMILEKADRYNELTSERKLLTEEDIEAKLTSDISFEKVKAIYSDYEAKQEIRMLERDLTSMCFALNRSENKISKQTNWERAYGYATEHVRISHVISQLLNVNNFKKNIRCPFHGEDRKPSLKVYPDDNFFICFACGVKGSPIDFIIQYKNCSFKEAVRYLSNL